MIDIEKTQTIDRILKNVEKVVIGKRKTILKILAALFAKGHILLEDVPGVGKTLMVKALAKSIGGTFRRVQFTPDLLPTDILGLSIYNQKTMEFEFRPGPIVTHILLADEINRTSPKTQSALLEAMGERAITVDGKTYTLEKPFLVMATQNPVEYEGTFVLPEAQMDRFMIKINLGYPDRESELVILDRINEVQEASSLQTVCTIQDIVEIQEVVSQVYVDDVVKAYIVDLCRKTREHEQILLGVSPRGSVSLYRAVQAWAFLNGRDYVTPDDVKEMIHDVLNHRILLTPDAKIEGLEAKEVIAGIVREVAVPITAGFVPEKRRSF